MVNLMQAWAEEYAKVAPGVRVEVSGGGSGVGVAALIRGSVDVASTSRDLKESEKAEAERATGRTPREYVVGYDALAVFVHRDNPVEELSFAQLREIYAAGGRVERWSEVGVRIPGVRDDRIVRVGRQSSGGTFEFLRHRVLGDADFRLGTLEMNGSKEVVELVSVTPTAVGYSGMGYAVPGVKMVRIVEEPGGEGVAPTAEATVSGRYPIARSLNLYVLGEPAGRMAGYLGWVMSEAGQALVEESGFVPVPPDGRGIGVGR
jgi:phosphate transport system substrate-binding protein